VKTLLVIECSTQLDWYEVFKGVALPWGEELVVEQAEWNDISLTSYHDSGAQVNLRRANRPLPGTSQENNRSVHVDFILLRSVTRGIVGQDSRPLLMAFMHANVLSMNSLESAYMCLERPIVFGALKRIQANLKKEGIDFPLIGQNLYPSFRELVIAPDFPIAGKIGHAHAGYGKMKIKSNEELQDFKSILALHNDYVSLEPFVEYDFDMRIQKIGNTYRGFRRMSHNWKANTGNASVIEDMEVTPLYKRWVDECALVFGGLDILGLDLLHSKATNTDYILELNDTAIGLTHKYEAEDMAIMRDLAMSKMNLLFAPPPANLPSASGEPDVEKKKSDAERITELTEKVALLEVQLANEKNHVKELTAKPVKDKKKKGFF